MKTATRNSRRFAVLTAYNSLFENLYRPQYLKGQETQSDLMRLAGQIARETPMVAVSRKRDPNMIDGW